jgi:hypothetical protein
MTEGQKTTEAWFVPAVAGLMGAIVEIAALGPAIVHPENIDWLMRGDFSLHFLGWHLYRSGPWTWPLGATPHLIWPVGSSVGLTDSIPLTAVTFKVFDPWLPPTFQFIGLWLVACFALQGIFGVLLMRLATPRPTLQLLGAALFIMSPPLIYRLGHAALSAHWVLLAALWLSLKESAEAPSWRRSLGWALLGGVTAAIQPYLLLMVALLMLADFARQALAAPSRLPTIVAHAGLGLGVAWAALWQSGSFIVPSESGLAIGGFGAYSSNLLTFIMPTEGWSLLWPGPIPYANRLQYEGYAYMGMGTLVLGLVVAIAGTRRLDWTAWKHWTWRYGPLVAALTLLALMALGPAITAGPYTLFKYDPHWWGPLGIFRTNGRMIWPLFYATVTAVAFAAVRFKPRAAVVMLSAAVLLQAVDVAGMTRFVGEVGIYGFRDPLNSRFWRVAAPHYQRLILVPTNVCDRNGFIDYLPFLVLAGREGLAVNAGTTARYDVRRAADYCQVLQHEVEGGLGAPGSLYVVRPDLLPRVAPQAEAAGSTCIQVDGYGVCYAAASERAWKDAFPITPEHRWR